jgi:hypothetical protein
MRLDRLNSYITWILLAALVLALNAPAASAADEQFNWRQYSFPEYRFEIMFPMEPGSTSKTVGDMGTPLHTLIVRYPGIVFQVDVAEAMQANHDLASVRAICDAMRRKMMSVDGVVRVYHVFQAKTLACEIVYDTDYDETVSLRLHMAGSRWYQTFVRGPRGYDSSADAVKFQDSFHALLP